MAEKLNIDLLVNKAQAAKSLSEIKTSLKELKNAALEAGEGTAAFNQLTRAAGELKDKVGDLNESVNFFSNDTKNLQGIVGTMQGIAGAFSVAQGAASLLGAENEDLNKALLKVQSSMAIMQGLDEVAKALNKSGAAAIWLKTVAQKAYTLAVGTSTGALKLFRIALAATGIGLAVVALGMLVEYWMSFNSEVKKSNEGLKTNNKHLEDAAKRRDDLKTSIELLKIKLAEETGLITSSEAKRRAQQVKHNAAIESENARHQDALRQQQSDFQKAKDKLKAEGKKEDSEEIKAISKKNIEIQKEMRKSSEEIIKVQAELNDAENALIEADETNDKKKIIEEARKKAKDDAERASKERIEFEKKVNKELLDSRIQIIEDSKNREIEVEKLNLERKKKELLYNDGELAALELKLSTEKNQKKIEELTKDIELEKQKKELFENLTLTFEKKKKEIEDKFAGERRAEMIQNLDNELQDLINKKTATQAKEIEIEKKKYDILISDQALSHTQRETLLVEHQKNMVEIAEKYKVDAYQASGGIKGLMEAQAKIKQQYEKGEIDLATHLAKKEEMQKAHAKDIGDFLMQSAQSIAQQLNEISANQSRAKLQILEEEASQESAKLQANFENNLMTKEEYEKRKKRADEILRKEQAKIKTEQAIKDKRMAMFSVIIDTARAIAAVSPAIPLMVMAGITGALQLGIIESQPIPKFKKGGMARGPGTGTSDSITAKISNGESIINAESTRRYLPLLSEINEAGGGVPLIPKFASGGIAQAEINNERMESIFERISNINITAQVIESEMTSSQRRIRRIEDRAKF
jgi:hypothetical protein